ncbi:MAG: hypothetical protein IJK33_09150 [Clostridia bacterium]|nr:hypothetical protein [Clostridia bacterium]
MKLKKLFCIVICVALLAVSLVSCSSGSKALFSFRGTELSNKMYSYMLSSQKAYLQQLFDYYNSMATMYGQEQIAASFEDYLRSNTTDADGNTVTVAQATNNMIIESAKYLVVIDHFCKQYGLEITDESAIAEIEEVLKEDIQNAGSMEYLNILLAQFGADYDVERQYLYSTMSAELLFDHLYGENGAQRLDESAVKEQFEKEYNKIDVLYYAYYDSDDEGNKTVKQIDSITDKQVNEYIADHYAKIKYVLLYKIDVTTLNKLSDETIAEKEATANKAFSELKNGEIQFDDAIEKYSESKSDPVILSKGETDERVKPVEDAAFEIKAGEYAFVDTDIGYYVIEREMLQEGDIDESIRSMAYEELAKDAIHQYALTAYEKVVSGMGTFDDYSDSESKPDAYGVYTKGIIYKDDEMDEEIVEKVKQMNDNDYAVAELASGCVVMKKIAFSDDDYKERYDETYESLAQSEFDKFIKGFYSEVIVDEEELSKFDFLTALALDLVPIDENS